MALDPFAAIAANSLTALAGFSRWSCSQVSLDAITVSLDSLADESIGTVGDGKDSIGRFGYGEQGVSGGDDDV